MVVIKQRWRVLGENGGYKQRWRVLGENGGYKTKMADATGKRRL